MSTWMKNPTTLSMMMNPADLVRNRKKMYCKIASFTTTEALKPIDSSEFLMKILSLAKLGIIWEVSEMISLELLKNGKKNLQHLTCHFDKRGRILLDSYLSKSSSFCIR